MYVCVLCVRVHVQVRTWAATECHEISADILVGTGLVWGEREHNCGRQRQRDVEDDHDDHCDIHGNTGWGLR